MRKIQNWSITAIVLLFLSSTVLGGCASKEKQLGIAFYSVKGMDSDIENSLMSLANDGYTVGEASNYNADAGTFGEYQPAEYAELAKTHGLSVISSHARATFDKDDVEGSLAAWKEVLDNHQAAGFKYVILPMHTFSNTLEGVKAESDLMNKIGEEANKRGLKFGYHNHSAEFEKIGTSDEILEDYLIANTDADKVFFQMDVYWVTQGNQDPVEYLKKYPNRFQVLHIKDDYVIGASGKIDYNAIFTQFYQNGFEDWFVEIEAKMTEEEREQMAAIMEQMKKAQEEGTEFKPDMSKVPGFGAPDPEKLKISLDAISESATYLKNSDFVK